MTADKVTADRMLILQCVVSNVGGSTCGGDAATAAAADQLLSACSASCRLIWQISL